MSGDVRRAAEILGRGGLVAFPTETVYGLGADASSREAVARLYAAKRRPPDHPVIVHFAGYRPSEEVNFYLYRLVGHRDRGTGESIFDFAATIGRTTADQRGEGVISFATERDDPVGKYLVVTAPLQGSDLDAGSFDFER